MRLRLGLADQQKVSAGTPGFAMTLNAPGVVGVFGNSFASQNWNTYTSTSLDRRSQGYATNLAFIMHQKVRCKTAGNFGVSGESLTAMLARRATAIAYNPDIWLLWDIVANDLTNVSKTSAQMIADINTLVADFAATNKLVIIGNSPPRSVWSSLTAPEIDARVIVQTAVRAHIATLPSLYSNVFVVDVWNETIDTGSAVNAPLAGYFYDGLHPNNVTGHMMAKKMKAVIESVTTFNFSTALPSTAGCKNTNPTLTGTGGNKGTGVTGTVPNNVSVERASGVPNAVCSIVTETIGGNSQTCLKIVVSGGTASGDELVAIMERPEILLGYTGGTDNFYAIMRAKMESPVGIRGFALQSICNMTTGTDPQVNDMINVSGQMWPSETIEGTFESEPLAVPVGARTSDRLRLRIFIDGTVPSNGVTVYIGQTEMRA